MKAKIINIFWLVTSNTTVQKTLIDFSMKNINPEFQRVFLMKWTIIGLVWSLWLDNLFADFFTVVKRG